MSVRTEITLEGVCLISVVIRVYFQHPLEPSLQKHYCQLETLPFLASGGEEQSQLIWKVTERAIKVFLCYFAFIKKKSQPDQSHLVDKNVMRGLFHLFQ